MAGSKSESTSDSSQNVWGAQAPFLQNLFQQGQNQLGQSGGYDQQIQGGAQQA